MVKKAMLAAVLLMLPTVARADVAPSRSARGEAGRARVEERLVAVGVPAETARAEAAQLSAADALYFAERAGGVQLAGHGGEVAFYGACGCCLVYLIIWLIIIL